MITIRNKILITDLSKEEFIKVKKFLTIDNPLYERLRKMEKSIWGIPKVLEYFEKVSESSIEIPVGALALLDSTNTIDLSKHKIRDGRAKIKASLDIDFKGELRDYQEGAVNAFKDRTIGVLQASTGSGKTVIAIGHICNLKQPTLILVNTLELLNQFTQRLSQFSTLKEEEIGIIGSGKFELKPVTVALLQTMNKLTSERYLEVNNTFGQVITDEVHIISADTYYRVINRLEAKYKFGLSATPKRTDGLTKVIFFATGPIVHKITDEEVGENILLPSLKEIPTQYEFPLFDSSEYQMMMDDLASNKERNKLIIDTHKDYLDKQSVFLCNRLAQADLLQESIPNSVVLSSKVSKKNRKIIMEKLDKNELKAVMTTYSLFSTGIDLANLERLYLCAPIRSEIKLIQSAGRIRRKGDDSKRPVITDFVDKEVGLLKNQWYSRRTVWKQLKII